jgi:ferrochelatase
MVLTRNLTRALAARFPAEADDPVHVDFAMCYGEPSIPAQMEQLAKQGITRFLILPLYPQYSSASTGAVFDAMARALLRRRHVPEVHYLDHYHDHPAYIEAISHKIRTFWAAEGKQAFLLMSFHGLPEVSRTRGDPYYEQCLMSARLIAEALHLGENDWQICFQSRFGPARWLQPYCIDVLKGMPERGIREVDLVCPGFAVDCLETLEEIAIANREEFLAAGGQEYRYIPALNDDAAHVDLMERLIRSRQG